MKTESMVNVVYDNLKLIQDAASELRYLAQCAFAFGQDRLFDSLNDIAGDIEASAKRVVSKNGEELSLYLNESQRQIGETLRAMVEAADNPGK